MSPSILHQPSSLVQQALRAVIWNDLPHTDITHNLRKHVLIAKEVKGIFSVKGYVASVWTKRGYKVSDEEKVRIKNALRIEMEPKIGALIIVRRDYTTRSWELTMVRQNGKPFVRSIKHGSFVYKGRVFETRVEEGGLVLYGPNAEIRLKLLVNSNGELLFTIVNFNLTELKNSSVVRLTLTYTTEPILE